MSSRSPLLLALLLAAGSTARPAAALPTTPAQFVDEFVAGPFDKPTNSAFTPDGRLFVVEQYTAQVRLVVKGEIAAIDPAGVVPEIRSGGEAGLIGVAVDPGFPARPYVYVQGTHRGPVPGTNSIRIWRYTLTGDLDFAIDGAMALDPASQYLVLADGPDAAPNHNGGTLAFGPDGRLYAAIGDDDNPCRAQFVNRLNGKILRLDVSGLPPGGGGPPPYAAIAPADNPFAAHPDSAAHLVWAMGLRNPFSFTIDPVTGCLHIADVGNDRWEELDVACAGGMNFGWPHYEGPVRLPTVNCPAIDTTHFVAPVHAYPHVGTGYAIVGGPLYRAPAGATAPFPPAYEGTWFYGDTWRGFLRRLVWQGGGWAPADSVAGQPNALDWANAIPWITSLRIGPDGSLWYTMLYLAEPEPGPGEVRRLRYVAPLVGVGDAPAAGRPGVALVAARPSPARATAGVELVWRQDRPAPVTLRVFDLKGRLVRRLVLATAGMRAAGEHRVAWDGRDGSGRFAPAGVYVARLEGGGAVSSLRLVRL